MERETPPLQNELQAVNNAERRLAKRSPVKRTGRLAFGGLNPGIINCEILDLSETGIRVRTLSELDPVPELFSLEFCDIYCRARLRWSKERELGLEFIFS